MDSYSNQPIEETEKYINSIGSILIINVSINTSKQRNALVVKLVDTKDLKAEGFTL